MTSKEFATNVCALLGQSGISNIIMVDVSHKTVITEYFVVGTAKNVTMCKAVAEELQEKLEKEGIYADRKDGEKDGRWIVLDYDAVIVHLFYSEMRDFYNFEKLWADPLDANIMRIG
jgi:ribosome-associated protein